MFKDRLFEELATVFGEKPVEWDSSQNSTNESIYVAFDEPIEVKVIDSTKINFKGAFTLTIRSERGDYSFGYLTTKFAMYQPNSSEDQILEAADDNENQSWDGESTLSISKRFKFSYSEEYDLSREKIKYIDWSFEK